MTKWKTEIAEKGGWADAAYQGSRPKPWKKKCKFHSSDVIGKMHLVLSNGVYIDTFNLKPAIQNQIRSMAAFDNPEFYKKERLGYSKGGLSSMLGG